MRTDQSVINYFQQKGLYYCEFDSEDKLLANAIDFLGMLPETTVIRMEATTLRGRSDLLICYKGRFCACELKDNTGVPSPQQIKFITQVKSSGGRAAVCRSLYDIYETLNI